MNPLDNLRPNDFESENYTTDFWNETASKWFIHSELQFMRTEYTYARDPFECLKHISIDPRAEGFDTEEFSFALFQQFIRFQENRPHGFRAVLSLVDGSYHDRIWGTVRINY